MRKNIRLFGKEFISWGDTKNVNIKKVIEKNPNIDEPNLPAKRVSAPTFTYSSIMDKFDENAQIIDPTIWLEFIPMIRRYMYSNENLSQALNNIIELGNTGHNIEFDSAVTNEQANKMKAHLSKKEHVWFQQNAGMNGFVNKLIAQAMIGGACSTEWVPNINLDSLKTAVLVDPETIRWVYNKTTGNYEPYQRLNGNAYIYNEEQWIKLNPNTFKYTALNGDTDNPYGIPPYLPVLNPLETQKLMLDNIKFIVEQVGIMGFMHVLMDKPDRRDDENENQYRARLEKFLTDARDRVRQGYRDGISVGYKDDTEFEFHPTSKNFDGVDKFFALNETLFAAGLKQDPSMLGKNYGATESQISIVFSKMLAQLKNIQNLVKYTLEFGYALELRLAGFQFNTITVRFNPSTALDRLKEEQADEVKIRNLNALYNAGIISQETFAHEMGYEKPDQGKPRVPAVDPTMGGGIPAQKKQDQAKKKKKREGARVQKTKPNPKEPKS